jgi:hypothetical protein
MKESRRRYIYELLRCTYPAHLHFIDHIQFLNMPFVIRPPLLSTAASNPGLIYIIIEPDDSERIILRDLQIWGWNITRHGFGDENFIDALKRVERDTKRRRRHIQAVAGKLHGYNERLSLDALWCQEVDRMLFEDAYEEQPGRQRIERVAEDKLEEQKLGEETPRIEKCVSSLIPPHFTSDSKLCIRSLGNGCSPLTELDRRMVSSITLTLVASDLD